MKTLIALSLFLLAACPNEDGLAPREACETTTSAMCERVYACLSPTELARGGFPATEAECVLKMERERSCATLDTKNVCDDPDETYHPETAETCALQLENMTCAELRSGDIEIAAPACERVCT